MSFKVWFFGSGSIAVPTLERLAQTQTILGVVTQPDRPRGRGQQPAATPIKEAALRLGFRPLEPESPSSSQLHETLTASQPDLAVVFAYGRILPTSLLNIPRFGFWNVHPSLLPKYRGAAPIPRAILNGEHTTGLTIFRMDRALDHGPILMQERMALTRRETTPSLSERAGQQAPNVLAKAFAALADDTLQPIPQDDREATMAPRFTKADGWVDWSMPASGIDRRVRALMPWPGTTTSWEGRTLKILRAAVGQPDAHAASPGTVLAVTPEALEVQAGEGTVLVQEVQLAGGRPVAINAFLQGHPIHPGHRLGNS